MSYEQKIKVPQFKEELGFSTTKERSEQMRKIRATNTKAEVQLRKALYALGYRYRINVKKLPGKPDIVFRKYKVAVFVDGEFWHGHNWAHRKKKLKANRGFWIPKIERNMQRDQEVNQALHKAGWTVIRLWEQQVKKELGACLNEVTNSLRIAQTDW